MTMETTTDDRPRRGLPERIGRYQVIERIGRGAMGVVYRAHDGAMSRDVALKVLMTDFEDDPEIRTRFHREAEAAARLSHPNIITIFDVGEDGERFFIVMELLRGATLRDFLKQGDGATLPRRLDLMSQLCAGLGSAHNAGIFHRDIKPGNIFVRSDGILKILDFGVARLATSNMTAAGFIVGTPDYMSPEQAQGADVDARSDIFSLGGVFYFMLTGRKPFPATDLPNLFRQIQNDMPAPIPESDAPPELAAIVMRALAKDPAQRYQSCQDLASDLDVLRLEHRLAAKRAGVVVAAAAAAPAAPAPKATSASAAKPDPASPSTDDTVDLPMGGIRTDETVSMAPPTWMRRMTGRMDVVVSGALERLRRSALPRASRSAGLRKR